MKSAIHKKAKLEDCTFSTLFTILKTNKISSAIPHDTRPETETNTKCREIVTAKLDDGQTIYSKANHFVVCSGTESFQYFDGRLRCFQARKGNQ
jgi:hypothetical protein